MPEKQYSFHPSVEKRRILVVEDEFINQEILKVFLSDYYEVIQAFTGEEALEIVSSQYETLSCRISTVWMCCAGSGKTPRFPACP